VSNDRLLFDWVRYYAFMVVVLTAFGLVGSALWAQVDPRVHEAWTVIVQTDPTVPARQLDTVSVVIFNSPAVYETAMEELGIRGDRESFQEENIELRPVPDSGALIVAGRAAVPERAEEISLVTARALIDALESRSELDLLGPPGSPQPPALSRNRFELALFKPLGEPQPVAVTGSLSPVLRTALGGLTGLLLGLIFAILHYRAKRPVMSLQRALSISDADQVMLVGERRTGWLRLPAWPGSTLHTKLSEGVRWRVEPSYVVVADAATGEEEIELARFRASASAGFSQGGGVGLLWIR